MSGPKGDRVSVEQHSQLLLHQFYEFRSGSKHQEIQHTTTYSTQHQRFCTALNSTHECVCLRAYRVHSLGHVRGIESMFYYSNVYKIHLSVSHRETMVRKDLKELLEKMVQE